MASSAMVTCSPVDSRTSSSRLFGRGVSSRARPSRRSVSPLMAETTTTTWCPWRRVAMTRSATALIRSMEPTEVPPYFWTMRAMTALAVENGREFYPIGVRSCIRTCRKACADARSGGAELLPDPGGDAGEGLVEPGRVGAARLGHVGTAAALASHLPGDEVHQLAGLDAVGAVAGDPGHEADLGIVHRGEHQRRAAQLVRELVHRVPQRLGVGPFQRPGQHLDAADVLGLAQHLVARGAGEPALELIELLLQPAVALEELLEAGHDVLAIALQEPRHVLQA